jgi:magnesium transporter
MNFEHMPELKWQWAYPFGFWAMIILLTSGMFYLFRRNKWL